MRSHSAALLLAAAAAIPPLLVVVCIGLAIARDPGAVDPAVGSVGYLVALSTGCLLAAGCLGAVRPASPAVVGRLIAGVLGGYALVALVIAATLLGSALAPAGPLAVALVGIVATALAAAAWWIAWRRLLAGIAANEPAPASAPRFAMLSPREHEVLALLADGARDAEIAARLHLSERTVESHLNRVFAKLGLDAADGRNRRILAVRAWAESGAPAPPANGLREKPDTAAGPIGRA
ncbi:helix-turn-helix transcriptional regulator [Schumannella luteola]|nr:helix-turn-helix transcriptional regulator [Schumannella luteola]